MNTTPAHAIITLSICTLARQSRSRKFVYNVHGHFPLWLVPLVMAFEQVPLDKFADTFATATGKIASVQSLPIHNPVQNCPVSRLEERSYLYQMNSLRMRLI